MFRSIDLGQRLQMICSSRKVIVLLMASLVVYHAASQTPAQKAESGSQSSEKSRRVFFALEPSKVLREVKARIPNSKGSVDLAVIAALRHVTYAGLPTDLNCKGVDVHISTSGGSRFHPTAGILIDETQVSTFKAQWPTGNLQGPAATAEALKNFVLFTVAHECAHAIQFRKLPRVVMETWAYQRFIECQADFLAGLAIAYPLESKFVIQDGAVLPQAIGDLSKGAQNVSPKEWADWGLIADGGVGWSRLAQAIGSTEWHDSTRHPPPPYRLQSALTGLYSGLFLRYAQDAEGTGSVAAKTLVSNWRSNYSLQPPLPQIGEDAFTWSRNAAISVLSQEPGLAEFPPQ